MGLSANASTADRLVARLRRRTSTWRALFVSQLCLLLFAGAALWLEWQMPGLLRLVLHSDVALFGVAAVAIVLAAGNDVAAAVTELRLHTLLRVPLTPLRRVLRVVYLVPGVMLVRRTLIMILLVVWLVLLGVLLLVWFLAMALFTLGSTFSARIADGFGVAVDRVDKALSTVGALVRRAGRTISLSPVRRLDHEEEVLPLLHRGLTAPSPRTPG